LIARLQYIKKRLRFLWKKAIESFDPTFFIAPAGASIGQPPQAALRPAEKVGGDC